jgi:two-component system sensor kinase FixL
MQDKPVRAINVSAIDWGGMAVVSVADHRLGPSEIFRSNGFEKSVSNSEEGADIGLYVSQLIVSAHGGRIWANDNPSGGSIIRFTLPLDICSGC